MTLAALFEIVEWISTKTPLGEQETKSFLGMQGDRWDAQCDMSYALMGTVLAYVVFSRLHDKLLSKENP